MNIILNKILSLLLLIIFSPLIVVIAILVYFTSSGPIIHWSKRFGKNNKFFYAKIQDYACQYSSKSYSFNEKS